MNRRNFIKLLSSSAIASTYDWESLLWIPNQMVTVPRCTDDLLERISMYGIPYHQSNAMIGYWLGFLIKRE